MNDTQQKQRSLTSFVSMFEEIKDNYNIDILKYDSFENFMIAFFSLLSTEELRSFPSELVILNKVIEKVKIA
ncbi:hypothetical protein [Lysinibacillus parviboronicapiens]|uniref:hypothetical protein n=1 Tax=Lysinibacillus parviboronicapiens TaxID=436516 RepID=UPI000D38A7F3|nr:hypothetical protein [Lysinibacillus parviboronicapiens]